MNKELADLDRKFSGIIPCNFASLSNNAEGRRACEYSWPDVYFNQNDVPFHTDTAIVVTAWAGQLGWLKATLTEYRKAGFFVILAYDNPFCIWDNLGNLEHESRVMLRGIHYLLAHAVVVKHKTYDADKRTGWFWNTKYAEAIIRGFPNIKYVYATNGDCVCERPEGFAEIKRILGDGDLISGQSEPGKTIHTADVLYKTDAFRRIMDYMSERNQFTIIGAQSPECMLRDAVNKLGLREVFAPQQPIANDGSIDYYCAQGRPSTWRDVLGFVNLYAEQEYRENHRLEPLDKKYFDPFMDWCYFRNDWRETICKYYQTGDRRYLLMWWDRGDDTAENRKFFDLEHYGKDPIYGSD